VVTPERREAFIDGITRSGATEVQVFKSEGTVTGLDCATGKLPATIASLNTAAYNKALAEGAKKEDIVSVHTVITCEDERRRHRRQATVFKYYTQIIFAQNLNTTIVAALVVAATDNTIDYSNVGFFDSVGKKVDVVVTTNTGSTATITVAQFSDPATNLLNLINTPVLKISCPAECLAHDHPVGSATHKPKGGKKGKYGESFAGESKGSKKGKKGETVAGKSKGGKKGKKGQPVVGLDCSGCPTDVATHNTKKHKKHNKHKSHKNHKNHKNHKDYTKGPKSVKTKKTKKGKTAKLGASSSGSSVASYAGLTVGIALIAGIGLVAVARSSGMSQSDVQATASTSVTEGTSLMPAKVERPAAEGTCFMRVEGMLA
jgi:hypothetical protein